MFLAFVVLEFGTEKSGNRETDSSRAIRFLRERGHRILTGRRISGHGRAALGSANVIRTSGLNRIERRVKANDKRVRSMGIFTDSLWLHYVFNNYWYCASGAHCYGSVPNKWKIRNFIH